MRLTIASWKLLPLPTTLKMVRPELAPKDVPLVQLFFSAQCFMRVSFHVNALLQRGSSLFGNVPKMSVRLSLCEFR